MPEQPDQNPNQKPDQAQVAKRAWAEGPGRDAAEIVGDPNVGPVGEALAPVAGFGVTFSTLFRRTATEQYPFEKVPVEPRFHGRHMLNRHPDGLEKCIGCELCAWACPADAIYVEAGNNAPDAQYSPGERYGRTYQINYTRCIFCGLCIEACPTRALTMSNDFELASQTREEMIYTRDQLLAPMGEGMLAAPHPMVEDTTDVSYYLGEVTGPTQSQVDWVREHRPDDETLDTAAAAAARGSEATSTSNTSTGGTR